MLNIKNILSAKSEIRHYVILGLFALLVGIYLFLCFIPSIKNLFSSFIEVARLKEKVTSTEREWQQLDALKTQVSRVNKQLDAYGKSLPTEKETPAILAYLSEAAKEMGVKINEIRQIDPDEEDNVDSAIYYQVPILVKAESGYHALGRFLNKLEDADRFIKIDDIKITSNAEGPTAHKVQLTIITYTMKK